jgi:hypothetical protein
MRTAGRCAVLGLLAALVLAGCNRNRLEPTECIGGAPEVARVDDVAPPNCNELVTPGA